jgi:hypothetical protein
MTPAEARQRALEAAADAIGDAWDTDEDDDERLRVYARAAVQAWEAALWQPIETAPRDGTRFHAWIPPNDMMTTGTVANCFWHLGGWYHPYFTEPTHWRPIPAGPGGMA